MEIISKFELKRFGWGYGGIKARKQEELRVEDGPPNDCLRYSNQELECAKGRACPSMTRLK